MWINPITVAGPDEHGHGPGVNNDPNAVDQGPAVGTESSNRAVIIANFGGPGVNSDPNADDQGPAVGTESSNRAVIIADFDGQGPDSQGLNGQGPAVSTESSNRALIIADFDGQGPAVSTGSSNRDPIIVGPNDQRPAVKGGRWQVFLNVVPKGLSHGLPPIIMRHTSKTSFSKPTSVEVTSNDCQMKHYKAMGCLATVSNDSMCCWPLLIGEKDSS